MKLLKIFFISTPAVTFYYYHSFTLDIYLFISGLILTLIIIKYDIWITSFLLFFISIVSILIHEIFASYYFLLLLAIFIHKFREQKNIIFLSIFILIIFILFFYFIIFKLGYLDDFNVDLIRNSLPKDDEDMINFMNSSLTRDIQVFFNFNQRV